MLENLIDLFTELSREIVKNELGIETTEFANKKQEKVFSTLVLKLRKKGFDILLRKYPVVDNADPCRTPYGADWDPLLLILDYAGALADFGWEKDRKSLISNVQILQKRKCSCLNEMYKLIFMLRCSTIKDYEESQRNFLSCVNDYSLKSNGPFASVDDVVHDITQKEIGPSGSLYDKNSTNLFYSGCQLLNNLTNRSNITSEKLNKYILSMKKSGTTNCSSSTIDYVIKKKSYSIGNFLQVANNNVYTSDHSLWNEFVDKPISFALRSSTPSIDSAVCYIQGSSEYVKSKSGILKLNDTRTLSQLSNYWTEVTNLDVFKPSLDKENDDETKITTELSNLSLYPILKENCLNTGNYESCFGRSYNVKKKGEKFFLKNSFFQSSPSLILALWEQEQKLYDYPGKSNIVHPQLRVLEVDQYLKDVQFLLIGVQTETFKINKEQLNFIMKEGTCLEGVTPNTLYSFTKDYLDIGECYLKLRHHNHENLKKQLICDLKDCRIILKVFWMSVFEYLCMHSRFVLKIPYNLGLLEFKARVRSLHLVITAVAKICKVSGSGPNNVLPQGGQLLTYLLDATQNATNIYVLGVLLEFLKSCCEVYLVQLLQNWMFQGCLGRHHRDFFVEHRPKNPRCKDRSYYLSFYLFNDRIPSFLKGLGNNIFNCGKTIHLLKLIQPESKLCRLLERRAYPRMKLCLSDDELCKQREKFKHYAESITEICGSFASIRSLKEEEKNREQTYENYILKVKADQQMKREQLKNVTIEELRRKRDEQNQWLKKQVELAAEEKRRKSEEEEEQSKLFLQKIMKITEEERKIVEEERHKLKLYYRGLIENVEKLRLNSLAKKQETEKHLVNQRHDVRLRNYRSNQEFTTQNEADSSDLTDPGIRKYHSFTTRDKEGNIVSPDYYIPAGSLDSVNSNVSSEKFDRIEDLQNKNISLNELTESQFQKLIKSREEYEQLIKFDSQSSLIEKENINSSNVVLRDNFQNTTNESDVQVLCFREASDGIQSKEETKGVKAASVVIPKESGTVTNKVALSTTESSAVETEAQRNKRNVLETEYRRTFCSPDNRNATIDKKSEKRTECEKNRRKVMTSEFEVLLKSDGNKKPSVTKRIPAEESEAQKNKRKVMGYEFGYGNGTVAETSGSTGRIASSAEAQHNKQKLLEVEFGYPRTLDEKISSEKNKEEKGDNDGEERQKSRKGECEISEAGSDLHSTSEVALDERLEYEIEKNMKRSSFAEKALKIFNSQVTGGSVNFFNFLNEDFLNQYAADDCCPMRYGDIQILFENSFGESSSCDNTVLIGNDAFDMDLTKFTNFVRNSVLIPLQIQEAIANEALFNHLLKEENMLSHFDSLRNYFFLNDGEFSRRLTQNIFATLAKCTEPNQFFKRSTLNKIVYEALNYTIHSNEPNTQNVSFEIVDMPELLSHSSHDVLTPFDLSYQVKWPLNIILTDSALSKYKLVFHFLLKLKRINWTLNENFSFLTYSCKDRRIKGRILLNSLHYHEIQLYRHAMGQFMRTLENYVSSCSLQFSWLNFQKDLETAQTLDHLYEKHVRYVKEVLLRCFLTKESHDLLRYINDLIELSLRFHYATISGKWVLVNGEYQHPKFQVLKETFKDFCKLTTEFLTKLRKKVNTHHALKPHEVLVEKFDIILR